MTRTVYVVHTNISLNFFAMAVCSGFLFIYDFILTLIVNLRKLFILVLTLAFLNLCFRALFLQIFLYNRFILSDALVFSWFFVLFHSDFFIFSWCFCFYFFTFLSCLFDFIVWKHFCRLSYLIIIFQLITIK